MDTEQRHSTQERRSEMDCRSHYAPGPHHAPARCNYTTYRSHYIPQQRSDATDCDRTLPRLRLTSTPPTPTTQVSAAPPMAQHAAVTQIMEDKLELKSSSSSANQQVLAPSAQGERPALTEASSRSLGPNVDKNGCASSMSDPE